MSEEFTIKEHAIYIVQEMLTLMNEQGQIIWMLSDEELTLILMALLQN